MRTNRKKRANKKIDKHALDMHNVENYVSEWRKKNLEAQKEKYY